MLRSLEGLRLIASLGIASIHMVTHVGMAPPNGFNLFVDLFFVISGIVIGSLYAGKIEDTASYFDFMQRRVARIYPLHVLTLIFYIAVGLGVAYAHLPVDDIHRYDPDQILPNLLLVQAWFPNGKLSFNYVSWSISAEFFVYLTFPAIALCVGRQIGTGLLFIAATLFLGIVASTILMSCTLVKLHWDLGELRALPSFGFGVWLSIFGHRFIGTRSRQMATTIFSLSACAFVGAILCDAPDYALLMLVYLVVASAYACDLSELPTFASWGPLSSLGHLTYSLYMLHVPVSTVFLSFVFPRIIGHGSVSGYVSLVLAVGILFMVAQLSFVYFETPMRRLLTSRPLQARGAKQS